MPIFAWNIPLVCLIFLKDISSLSHSIVFLYLFALITEEGFLISPCYSLELCIQWVYLFFSPLPFVSLLFSAICKASPNNRFAFLHFFFLGMVLITATCAMSWTSIHSSSGTLSIDLISWIYLLLPLYNCEGFKSYLNGLAVFPISNKLGESSGEFWQNVVHWRREWQATSVFLIWEPHEQYEKAKKIWHWKMNSPGR